MSKLAPEAAEHRIGVADVYRLLPYVPNDFERDRSRCPGLAAEQRVETIAIVEDRHIGSAALGYRDGPEQTERRRETGVEVVN